MRASLSLTAYVPHFAAQNTTFLTVECEIGSQRVIAGQIDQSGEEASRVRITLT